MGDSTYKTIAIENFSKYASSYDRYADIQNEAAGMLAGMLPQVGVANILEIGCGTGNYTQLLKNIFSGATIRAIDISGPMVQLARQKMDDERVSFEVGDAEEIAFRGKYDLVTSNAVFHWLGDPDGMIGKSGQALTPGGLLAFSAFGPMTFLELKASLVSAIGQEISIASDFFPKRIDIENMLKKYFKNTKITERLIRETYPSLQELLKKIKYSGTRGRGVEIRKIWSPDLLKRTEQEYVKRFGSIEATYQVFFCEGRP